jgi:hypothetical protein
MPHPRRPATIVLATAFGLCVPWSGDGLAAAEPPPVQFTAPVPFDTGEAGPVDLERADFNDDGLLDVAILTTTGGGRVHFLVGDGAGGLLKDNTLVVAYATGLVSGDFNRDGRRDLAVTQGSKVNGAPDGMCDTPTSILPSTLVFLGTGGGTPGFTLRTCLRGAVRGHHLTDAAVGDFDADGNLDVAVADDGLYGMRLYRGAGDGTFLAPVAASGSGGLHVFGPLTSADMNGDGRLDVVARVSSVGTYFGNGAGGLAFSSTPVGSPLFLQHLGVQSFAVGDLNNDGRLDIAGIERGTLPATPTVPENALFVSLNTGNGINYTPSNTHAFPQGAVGGVALADLNRDGYADVAAVHLDGNAARIHRGYGDGTLTAASVVPVGVEPLLPTAGDWNGDGWLDLAIVDRNLGDASRTWVLSQVPRAVDGTAPTVSLTSPAAGATVAGTVVVAAIATDDVGVTRVDFYQGTTVIGIDAAAPYQTPWDTGGLPNAGYVLTAKAYDAAGNVGLAPDVAVTVANPEPDLTVINPSVSQALLLPGASFTAFATAHNQGAAPSTMATTLRYYQSPDPVITTGDLPLAADSIAALAAGGSSPQDTVLAAPAAPGSHWIGACVDAVPRESSTTNQCSAGVPITVALPDLVVSLFAAPATAFPGEPVAVSSTVRNQGPIGSAAGFRLGIYYSADAACDTADVLVGTRVVGALGAGLDDAAVMTITVPATAAPGARSLCAAADDLGQVAETSEANNLGTDVILIAGPSVDLKVNGSDAVPPAAVASAGPVRLALDMTPGSAPLAHYWGIFVGGTLVWVTPSGLSATPAPLGTFAPVAAADFTLLDVPSWPAGPTVFLWLMVDGTTVVGQDVIQVNVSP